jgi:hypothetical protein
MKYRKGDPARKPSLSVIHFRASKSDAQSVLNRGSNFTTARPRCRIIQTAEAVDLAFPLARRARLCFVPSISMETRSAPNLRRVSLRLLAASLAVLIFLLSLLSANDFIHRWFHHNEAPGATLCAVCLLVKGHLETPAPAPVVRASVSPRVSTPLRLISIPRSCRFDSAPSRAPPALSSAVAVAV